MQPEGKKKKAKMDWPEASITPLSIILYCFSLISLLGFIDLFIHSTNTFEPHLWARHYSSLRKYTIRQSRQVFLPSWPFPSTGRNNK